MADESARARERATLTDGAQRLGCALPEGSAERLLTLLDQLARWNRAYNLTAIEHRTELITHHLLDSLAVHADLAGARVADVGTGAGFPGLPLALLQPQRSFTLIDASQKKLRFVTHAARVLELANVTALHARVERLAPETAFDTVVARAFAPLPELLAQVQGLCSPATRVLAMKGRLHAAELAGVADPWRILSQRALEVPGLGEMRHLVVLGRT
jgi:16S rRNA (guanine527-N7)-methyltransferase